MNRTVPAAIALVFLLGVEASPALAGAGWHLTFRSGPEGRLSEVRMVGGNLRAGEVDSGQEVIVDAEAFTVLDNRARTYMVVTFAQIEYLVLPMMKAVKEAAASQEQRLRDALEQLSPEERAEAEQQLGRTEAGGEAGPVSLERTGETAKVAGLEAVKMLAMQAGKPVAEVWVTDAIPTRSLRGLLDRFAGMLSGVVPDHEAEILGAWPDLEGFPVWVVDVSEGEPRDLLLLTGAERMEIPDAVFEPPAGYAKSALGLGGPGGR